MSCYEFQVVPAPVRSRKLTDLTKDQDQFCATVTDVLTDMGLAGWEFVGAETLPHYQRRMLIFSSYQEKTCLVFRREIKRLVEPKRLNRPSAEVTKLLEPQPVRQASPAAAEKIRTGARRLNISMPEQPKEKPAPLRLENPIEERVVPIRIGHKRRAALSALERAVSMDPQPDRHA